MKHIGLFEGIGGFSLAARWMGWETIAWCEWNEFCQKVLSYHFTNAKQHGDITKTDFTIYRGQCDILTGGFPCQPYSTAGKRLGKEDDRHLWPEMLRAIREIQPRWIVGENVRGLINWNGGMVFDEVQTDLEAEGYEVTPFLLPACAVNAPHRRDRIWFVAHRGLSGQERIPEIELQGRSEPRIEPTPSGLQSRDMAEIHVPYTNNKGLQRGKNIGGAKESGQDWNKQPPRFLCSEWQEFPTQPPICGGNDGVPNRMDRIKALGNAIVPQVAFQIYKAIEAYESQP